jgi:hypothetical protein
MGSQSVETCIQQDEYQELMNSGRIHVENDANFLLEIRELDLAHRGPDSWQRFPFEYLVPWLDPTKRNTVTPPANFEPIDESSLSYMRRKAYQSPKYSGLLTLLLKNELYSDHLFLYSVAKLKTIGYAWVQFQFTEPSNIPREDSTFQRAKYHRPC